MAFSSPGIQEASRQYLKEVAEAARRHAAGAQAHAAEELRKYGYRPAIRQQSLPSPPLEPNGMACLFVPVTAGSRLYLVDLFMLESFCTEYSKAGQPQPVGPEHYVFRSDQEVALATAVPAKEFCAQAWRVQLE